MSDIYDENENLSGTRSIAQALHDKYDKITYSEIEMDINERRRCTNLSMRWPGDDTVRQIMIDTIRLMMERGIGLRDIKW
jgi:hypothetical protein